jgi:hypothetical protein
MIDETLAQMIDETLPVFRIQRWLPFVDTPWAAGNIFRNGLENA